MRGAARSLGPIRNRIAFAHDTLNGTFSGPDSIIKASSRWVPEIAKPLEPSRRVVELTDGVRSVGDIAAQLSNEFPDEWVSSEHAESYVRWVLGPVVGQ